MNKIKKADFSAARKNMVDCQLMTNGITSEAIIDSFARVPREIFIPDHCSGAAYLDEDVSISNDAFLIEPVVHARLLQHAMPHSEENALVVGDNTGYGAAVLSNLVSTAVILEERLGALDHARSHWDALGCCNIAIVQGTACEGECQHAPYNLIFMQGAVSAEPVKLLEQLDIGGRLVCVYRENVRAMGQICVFRKMADGSISRQLYQDAATPYLGGFEPEERFVF
ncbi:MAG: protein-L-isoaspartate O-methyltransferase [Pseudomonadota bacterium]|nr:protein-L-isoaspartate O-methyltransferase [Pseudomonadota bacterium]